MLFIKESWKKKKKKNTFLYIQPQIRKSWDSMENANKKESSDF